MADLNFLNTTNCDAITFNTPTTGLQYVDYILGSAVKDFTNVDKYTITHSTNCCTPGIITNIAPRYQFVLTLNPDCVNSDGFDTYSVQFAGFNASLISGTPTLLIDGVAQTLSPLPPYSGVLIINLGLDETLGTGTPVDTTYKVTITTTSGFVYIIDFIITKSGVACDGILSGTVITYPALPSNIVQIASPGIAATTGNVTTLSGSFDALTGGTPEAINLTADNTGIIGNNIVITGDGIDLLSTLVSNWNAANPTNTITLTEIEGSDYTPSNGETFTLSGGVDEVIQLSVNSLYGSTTMLPGTYEIIFCEVNQDTTSTCIQNHTFIDCGTLKCQVVNKWVLCVDSNIMDFYNALLYSNDCTSSVSYSEICALYEILIVLLQTDGCFGRIDDCNCSDASTVANKLNPIAYPTNSNNNPCSSC